MQNEKWRNRLSVVKHAVEAVEPRADKLCLWNSEIEGHVCDIFDRCVSISNSSVAKVRNLGPLMPEYANLTRFVPNDDPEGEGVDKHLVASLQANAKRVVLDIMTVMVAWAIAGGTNKQISETLVEFSKELCNND